MRVAIFPARGGSVRIPRKNIRDFMGKPMMQWPIEAVHASHLFDMVIVTTDDQEIAVMASRLYCVVHHRQPDDGTMGTQEIAARVLDTYGHADEACVIYPCTPMLTAQDLRLHRAAWQMSGEPFSRSVLHPMQQDAGAMYWGHACAFRQRASLDGNCADLEVDPDRFIDINTTSDWAQAESMFTALRRAP